MYKQFGNLCNHHVAPVRAGDEIGNDDSYDCSGTQAAEYDDPVRRRCLARQSRSTARIEIHKENLPALTSAFDQDHHRLPAPLIAFENRKAVGH